MNDKTSAPLARIAAAKALLERGWGKPPELAQAVPAEQPILKVVREIVHVAKTPEQIAEGAAGEPPLIEWEDVRIQMDSAADSAAMFMSTPMRRMCSGCCARAASGHAATAPPRSVMNSRLFIQSPRRRGRGKIQE